MSVLLNIIECVTQYRPLFHLCQNWFYFSALFTINSLYGFTSPLVSSILLNSLSCSISCCNVSALIILPDYTFLYTCLACSSVKYWLSLDLLQFTCPPMLVLRGKYVLGSFLSFISLNVLVLDFLVLLRLLCVFVANGFNDFCSSSRLSICWSCSISLSSLEVG